MADEVKEEDEWLYGDSGTTAGRSEGSKTDGTALEQLSETVRDAEGDGDLNGKTVDSGQIEKAGEDGDSNKDGESESEEEDSDDDDDDGVNVVIGEVKSSQQFGSAKRPGPPPDKKGKFSTDDFEGPGTINGVPAPDFNMDSLEDKPWRKPGADITDYFNYGFTEETWRAYSERQKRLRFEAGGNANIMVANAQPDRSVISVAITNDGSNSKYGGANSNIVFPKKINTVLPPRKDEMRMQPESKANVIQVMTADRREYSRKAFDVSVPPPPFDMSVPPPSFGGPPPDAFMRPPPFFNQPPPQFYPEESPSYDEPNWMDSSVDNSWNMGREGSHGHNGPSSIVSIPKATSMPPPPGEGDSDAPPEKVMKLEK